MKINEHLHILQERMNTYEKVINECDAYEPYRPMTAEEQMSMEECIHALEILRCQHFGQRFGMALGIAIRRLQQQQNQEQL